MKFNAAICFMLCGASLWLFATRPNHAAWARACAALALVMGGLTLIEYLIGRDLGIDQSLVTDRSTDPGPGRIPMAGAFNFALLGFALLAIDVRGWGARWPALWLALIVASVSFVVVIGYAYEVSSLYRPTTSSPVALHGVIAFLLLSIGLLLARPDRGLVAAAVADDAGGVLIRRLLPAALLLPPVLGWARLQGEQAGLYGTESGLAVYVTTVVGVLSLLIWSTAATVKRIDAERRGAEGKVFAQLARLDLLSHITRAIGERQDLRSIFQVVVRSLEDHLPIDWGCVLLYDAAAGTLTVDAIGVRGAALAEELALSERARLPLDGDGLAACMRGQLVHEPDLAEVRLAFAQRLARGGLRSLVMAPLVVEGHVIGVLASARRAAHSFSSGDCEFLKQLSEHVALATHQSQLHSALQRAYDELHQSQQSAVQQERLRALGQMASGIAHDINNAISPVVLYTEHLLERESGLTPGGREALTHIARSIDDVAATVARMRDFYRQREGALPMVPMNLNGLVQQVVDLTRARWSDMPQQRGIVIRMRTDLAQDLPLTVGVEGEIREALINLVFNAVDAMPDGGVLTLRTGAAPSGGSQLEVEDTGTGMDEDTRQRCLEPFFTTKGERGTGLGLAMVYGT
ncbi:MAG TPA: GAF domain-containing protein, partial [Burkholderiaceae bacterium]